MSGKASENGANGNHRGTISRLGSQAIRALTPQFLALILLNMLFFAVLFWYLDARAKHSVEVINQLLTSCLKTPL
jgi:hypothetical protein